MRTMLGSKGFVTIATGDLRYYKMARNLLKSYRLNANCKLPFAIIADRENTITKQFDFTIQICQPSNTFNDKLRIYEYMPFEETIFIDADSLIYDDLNSWWERFSDAGDFCAFGVAHEDLNSNCGWFRADGMKEFKGQFSFIPMYNGGVYYLRNTVTCKKVFDLAQHCADHYNEYSFSGFSRPADEPVLALGMAVCGCRPIRNEMGNQTEYLFAPKRSRLKSNITLPKAEYHRDDKTIRARLIHWSNYLTEKSTYRFEVWRMNHIGESTKALEFSARHLFRIYDVRAIMMRAMRGIRRKLKV